jgi:integrase
VQFSIYSLYKGALVNPEQHQINIRALDYWQNELINMAEGTRYLYHKYFLDFANYLNQTPDQILEQRKQDSTNPNKQIQRRYETLFKEFLAEIKPKYAPLTRQTIYASIRSFFEIHDYPLRMRRNDYPKGKGIGVKRATDEAILKVLENKPTPTLTALIHTLKDTGLRISDLKQLKCNLITDNPNATTIPIIIHTEKTGLIAKTFIGEEAITALKNYLRFRERGTRKIPPETIAPETPLFKKRHNNEPMARTTITVTIQQAFIRTGEKRTTAHSLRKRFQTVMEKAKVPNTWIDQMLGHELSYSLGAYSLPTDQELQQAYTEAYNKIRIYPKITTYIQQTAEEPPIAEATTNDQAKQLILKGYTYQLTTPDGTMIFRKPE